MLKFLIKIALFVLIALGIYFLYKKFSGSSSTEPIISHHTLAQEITALGKLELVSYRFKDVVEYQKEPTSYSSINYFLPTLKAVLIVSGEAIGCIDLTKIKEEDIVQGIDTIVVFLPKPELCTYKIDHQNSKVYDVSKGYLVEQGLMVSEAFKQAEQNMKQSAMEQGILEETNRNAHKILTPLLKQLSGKAVVLKNR